MAAFRRTAAAAAAFCFFLGMGGLAGTADEPIELPIIQIEDQTIYESNGYSYKKLLDGTARIVKCNLTGDKDMLFVPAEIEGRKVSIISEKVFGEDLRVGTLVIPVTVREIDAYAAYLTDIGTVILPPAPTEIPENAFYTKDMDDAYKALLKELEGGEVGELIIIPQSDIVKPVCDYSSFVVRCCGDSKASDYADAIGSWKDLMIGYTGAPGDINCDGKLNNRDIKKLQKFLTGSDLEAPTPSYDADGNGVLNNSDLKCVQKYLTGQEVSIY